MNPGFTRRIVGYKDEESEYLLKFLYDHISQGADFQIRARYEPGTVVVWVRTLSNEPLLLLTWCNRTTALRLILLSLITALSSGDMLFVLHLRLKFLLKERSILDRLFL